MPHDSVVKASEAKKLQQINEADGEAHAILSIARATSDGLSIVAEAVNKQGGREAMQLRVAEQYIQAFGQLAKSSTALVVPASVSDLAGMATLATTIFNHK
ncbi:MAG: hypothetical protein D6690_14555 [Nitrospirae bacterium]|nr:MAG: hypothetical protein D6690_14555 [Nitrospirota bacterium]